MHVCEPKSQFKIFIEKHRTKNIKDTLEEEKKCTNGGTYFTGKPNKATIGNTVLYWCKDRQRDTWKRIESTHRPQKHG